MRTLEPVIAEHPFFKGLKKEHIQLLVGCAANAAFQPGTFLCHAGDEADTFYIIRQGKVTIEISQAGRESINIETVGEGQVLGWSWLIPPHEWRFDARAIELTRAVALDGGCLRSKCEEDTELGYELMKRFSKVLAQRLESTRMQLMDLYAS